MSVDKFGRHADSPSRCSGALKGPKGEGFDLTSDGHYNIKKKRLTNIDDPQDVADAVNKQYLDSRVPAKSAASYSFHNFGIKDVAYPAEHADGDAVNVKYMKDNCLTTNENGSAFDAKGRYLTNVNEPILFNDVATKVYVDNKVPVTSDKVQYWSFANKRLVSVGDPINDQDVVTLKYLKNGTPKKANGAWTFGNRRLMNIGFPKESGDAVNIDYLDKFVLCANEQGTADSSGNVVYSSGAVFDAKGNSITNVGKPVQLTDAVNRVYLKEALADLGYALYLNAHRKKPQSREAGGTVDAMSVELWKNGLDMALNKYPNEQWRVWEVLLDK